MHTCIHAYICGRTIKTQLERARTEIERLQKAREETASSPRDQRCACPTARLRRRSSRLSRHFLPPLPLVGLWTHLGWRVAHRRRYMPTNMSEAVALASQDEEEAAAALQAACSTVAQRARKSPQRRTFGDGPLASDTLVSAIAKQRR